MPDSSAASIPPPRVDSTLDLSDGRTLGYAEYGPSDGDPLFFFHGSPGSRYTRVPDTSILEAHDVRQINVERPGFGKSTYDPDRSLLDWPGDVRAVADHLELDEFAVAGASGGGPFTLACAAELPERLTAVGVLAGAGPLDAPGATDGMEFTNKIGFKLAKIPYLLRPLLWLRIRKIRRDPEGFIDDWADRAADPDAAILERPDVRAVIRQHFPEATRQGPKAMLYETRLLAGDWGFDLADISVDVDLWHGELDTMAPPPMARHVASEIPSCTTHFMPDEGHLFIYTHWDEILDTLFGE